MSARRCSRCMASGVWTTTGGRAHKPLCSRCVDHQRASHRAAVASLVAFGEAIAYAIAARAALLGLGIAEEDHERVVAAHFALTRLGEVQR